MGLLHRSGFNKYLLLRGRDNFALHSTCQKGTSLGVCANRCSKYIPQRGAFSILQLGSIILISVESLNFLNIIIVQKDTLQFIVSIAIKKHYNSIKVEL